MEQDLEAIETAGTWYSGKEGYWYYLRLSRSDWEAIQEKRARDMAERIGEMFRDVFRDTLSELKAIRPGLIRSTGTTIPAERSGWRSSTGKGL